MNEETLDLFMKKMNKKEQVFGEEIPPKVCFQDIGIGLFSKNDLKIIKA